MSFQGIVISIRSYFEQVISVRTQFLMALLTCLALSACDKQSIDAPKISTSCVNNAHCIFTNKVEVWLTDSKVVPEMPFTLNLLLPLGAKVTTAQLDGVTMYMGTIPLLFKQNNQKWVADTMVGSCSEPVMTWKMTVNYSDSDNQVHSLVYYFDVAYKH